MTARTPDFKRSRAAKLQDEGLTQDDIAERLGVNQSTVARMEHAAGKRRRKRRSFADQATGFAQNSKRKGRRR